MKAHLPAHRRPSRNAIKLIVALAALALAGGLTAAMTLGDPASTPDGLSGGHSGSEPPTTASTSAARTSGKPTPRPTRPRLSEQRSAPQPSRAPSAASSTTHAARPGACAHGGSYLWAHLEACGWPGPANTGAVPGQCPGGALAANDGSASRTIRVTKANAVVSCQKITGCLSIEAPHVTVRNVAIACTSGRTGEAANGTSVINVGDGASATIEHVDIDGMDGVHACIWHQGTAMTAVAVDCHGVNDGIFSWADTGYSATTGDHFTIKDSYLHDFTTKTANGHIDGYQTEGAANGSISHNTFLMTSDNGNRTDSAIAIWNSRKNSHDVAVSDNLIAGGGFAVYAEDYNPSEASPGGGYTVTDISVTGNRFSTRLFGCVGYYGVWFPRGAPSDGWQRSGNTVLETGAAIDAANPTYQGRSCT